MSDGFFNSIWIKGRQILDKDRNMKLKTLTVKNLNVTGTSNGSNIWVNQELPDADNESWAPLNNTHYFHTNLTDVPNRKVLTVTQASINAAHPDVPDKTMIFFDFPPTLSGESFDLLLTDVYVFEDETDSSPPRTYEYIYYMYGGYLLKENGVWLLVMPVFSYD